MRVLDKQQVKKVEELITEELNDKGFIIDIYADLESDRFIHQVAKLFYSHDDSSDIADDAFNDVLTVVESKCKVEDNYSIEEGYYSIYKIK